MPVLDAARAVMGGIDLDPASSAAANRRVRAARYYTEADNGLAQPWSGRVWLNPPFDNCTAWAERLMSLIDDGHVDQACLLGPMSKAGWFRALVRDADAVVVLDPDLSWEGPDATRSSPWIGEVIGVWSPNDAASFETVGAVIQRARNA